MSDRATPHDDTPQASNLIAKITYVAEHVIGQRFAPTRWLIPGYGTLLCRASVNPIG